MNLRAIENKRFSVPGMATRVVCDGSNQLGLICYAADIQRWFVLSGFDDQLPYRWHLHMTLERSLKKIEERLTNPTRRQLEFDAIRKFAGF